MTLRFRIMIHRLSSLNAAARAPLEQRQGA